MPLTVAGDFAWPGKDSVNLDEIIEALSASPLVLNFEGAFVEGSPEAAEVVNNLKFNLYSDSDAIGALKRLNVVSLGLANNHIGDYRGACADTIRRLERAGFSYFGLQQRPFADVRLNGALYRFIGVVSPLTEITRDHGGLTANPFAPDAVLSLIGKWRKQSDDLKIVVFVHWGYELARYPLPADRAWAHQAVHAGADFVIGHHPHVVQGIERIENGIVAYSLGNFVLPQVRYRDRRLSYSEPAVADQLAMTLENDPLLIWTRYVASDQSIVVKGTERLAASTRVKDLTPFAGMTETAYRRWFSESKRSGTANIKRSFVVLWSYSGTWKLHLIGVFFYLRLRRLLRSLLIKLGIHRPYNWEEE